MSTRTKLSQTVINIFGNSTAELILRILRAANTQNIFWQLLSDGTNGTSGTLSSPNMNIPDELGPPSDPGALLQLDYLRPAGNRLVERGDPAHASPSTPPSFSDLPPPLKRPPNRRKNKTEKISTLDFGRTNEFGRGTHSEFSKWSTGDG
jgi:hypothetical protein